MSRIKKCCCGSGRHAGMWLNQKCDRGQVVLCFRCYQALMAQLVIEEVFESVGEDFHDSFTRAHSIVLRSPKSDVMDAVMDWFCLGLQRLRSASFFGINVDQISHAIINTHEASALVKASYARIRFKSKEDFDEWNRKEKLIASVRIIPSHSVTRGHIIFVPR